MNHLFICNAESADNANISIFRVIRACNSTGISRKAGHKLFNRYKDDGLRGLEDRPRSPYRHPNQLPFQVETAILRIIREHTSRGAPKIRDKLAKAYPMIRLLDATCRRFCVIPIVVD